MPHFSSDKTLVDDRVGIIRQARRNGNRQIGAPLHTFPPLRTSSIYAKTHHEGNAKAFHVVWAHWNAMHIGGHEMFVIYFMLTITPTWKEIIIVVWKGGTNYFAGISVSPKTGCSLPITICGLAAAHTQLFEPWDVRTVRLGIMTYQVSCPTCTPIVPQLTQARTAVIYRHPVRTSRIFVDITLEKHHRKAPTIELIGALHDESHDRKRQRVATIAQFPSTAWTTANPLVVIAESIGVHPEGEERKKNGGKERLKKTQKRQRGKCTKVEYELLEYFYRIKKSAKRSLHQGMIKPSMTINGNAVSLRTWLKFYALYVLYGNWNIENLLEEVAATRRVMKVDGNFVKKSLMPPNCLKIFEINNRPGDNSWLLTERSVN